MQDEELDKIINDAANQHHPPYDDKAWGKMMVLLDKHLPQKKDRRKPLAFWLLFLLLGGAVTTAVVIQLPENTSLHNKPVAQTENETIGSNNITQKNDNSTTGVITITDGKDKLIEATQLKSVTGNGPAATNSSSLPATGSNTRATFTNRVSNLIKNKSRTSIKAKMPVAVNDDITNNNSSAVKKINGKTKATIKAAVPVDEEEKTVTVNNKVVTSINTNDSTAIINKQTDSLTTKTKTPVNDMAAKQITAATPSFKKQTNNKSFKNNFAITVSAGADKSFIQTTNPGKTKFIYGAGVAYSFAKNFTAEAGFFVSRKVYDAKPADYKFYGGATYPNLYLINANCKVYEIPVSISYNFAPGKKHSWFATGGLSSIIMKKEDYNYKYKTPSGQYYNYTHTYTNENKHFFSVITLAGGYQYSLNHHLQFMAGPYLKMPLSGIGAGSIKLKSGGVLLTAAIKPFAKK